MKGRLFYRDRILVIRCFNAEHKTTSSLNTTIARPIKVYVALTAIRNVERAFN